MGGRQSIQSIHQILAEPCLSPCKSVIGLTVEGFLYSIESECLDGSAISKMFYSDIYRKHAFYDTVVETGRILVAGN